MQATIKNIRPELQKALLEQGRSLEDKLDIETLDKLCDELSIPQAEPWKGFQFFGHSRNQRNEDGMQA